MRRTLTAEAGTPHAQNMHTEHDYRSLPAIVRACATPTLELRHAWCTTVGAVPVHVVMSNDHIRCAFPTREMYMASTLIFLQIDLSSLRRVLPLCKSRVGRASADELFGIVSVILLKVDLHSCLLCPSLQCTRTRCFPTRIGCSRFRQGSSRSLELLSRQNSEQCL